MPGEFSGGLARVDQVFERSNVPLLRSRCSSNNCLVDHLWKPLVEILFDFGTLKYIKFPYSNNGQRCSINAEDAGERFWCETSNLSFTSFDWLNKFMP